jgi:hypothetical protein
MKGRDKLARIRLLSQLVLDGKLNALERTARARQHSLDHLAELNRPLPETDLPAVVAGEVAMRYQNWADQRRGEINLTLARQTVEWIEAREAATRAFGRNQALNGLIKRK